MKSLSIFIMFLISFNSLALEEGIIHVERSVNSRADWMANDHSEEANLKKLLELLSRSETGLDLIKKARYKAAKTGLLLEDVIKIGESSLTDTTLVRKFSPHSPEHVIYETRSVVYINRNLSWNDALLDLSHELTHYVKREGFNPYADSFNAQDFIKSTIEGAGGEVEAFLTECQVMRDLFSQEGQSRSHCQKIIDHRGSLSFSRAVELFYGLGDYFQQFKEELKKREVSVRLPFLSGEKINFISSAYGVPYPIAALMEYDLVISKVCENDKKRLAYMQQGPKREPSSLSLDQINFIKTHQSRCSGI